MIRSVIVSLVVSTAVLLAPDARAAEPAPVQLVQAGDSTKSCEVLAAEINTLASTGTTKTKPKKKGFGGFGKLLGMAAPMLGGGLALGGHLVGQAASVAEQGAMEAAMREQTDAAVSAIGGATSVEAQRKARLISLFEEKAC